MIAFLAISATSVFMATLLLFLALFILLAFNIIQNFPNMFITRVTFGFRQHLPIAVFDTFPDVFHLNWWNLYR